ncbi:hypothetical protein Tco_0997671 [Tanacetum coccineum]|uniref:Uncharacterized protein n=1 Tax=Tanacetum coccineum TaxID=301880 RepID=A0ABQ4YB30_9ASTR
MLTIRKRVGQLPTHRLTLRYSVDYSLSYHFTSDDSSCDSSSDSSLETSSDSHSDTSSNSSFGHSSLVHSIPDSPCDSSTAISVGPSSKRRRSPATLVLVASLVPGALSPIRVDLLQPHKRIKDFDSITDFEVSSEEGYEPYIPREVDVDACIAFADAIEARGTNVTVEVRTTAEGEAESSMRGTIESGVDRVTHPVVSEDTAEPVRKDYPNLVSADRSLEVMQRGLDVVMQELYDHMREIPVERIAVIKYAQRSSGYVSIVVGE